MWIYHANRPTQILFSVMFLLANNRLYYWLYEILLPLLLLWRLLLWCASEISGLKGDPSCGYSLQWLGSCTVMCEEVTMCVPTLETCAGITANTQHCVPGYRNTDSAPDTGIALQQDRQCAVRSAQMACFGTLQRSWCWRNFYALRLRRLNMQNCYVA
jgi:hypothetical protein